MDLTTTYMGLTLKNPVVPSSSPISHSLDGIRKLEDAGAGAVVIHSLFEEQITMESYQLDHYLNYATESFAEALTYFPDLESFNVGPDEYVELVSQAKKAVDIPIIGSLNGVSNGGWVEYAKKIEQAGADGLELNIYYLPTSATVAGTQVEELYLNILQTVKSGVSIPVAVKLNPFFSSIPNMVDKLAGAGADALVLFNRFYQPDLNIDALEVEPTHLLSSSGDILLSLRWTAILYGRVETDFAITNGVHTHEDVLKGLMAGAKITMMASELLQNGVGRIGEILEQMSTWMEEHEYKSVQQMQGSMSQKNVTEPGSFERANYMKVLESWRPDPAGLGFKKL
ncbi:MAG: dihydroorotate dehydrogenase-like protein [Anaerolineae bacterium]|nr:dihydroorotate dehydrogenase-like protein [Anaerolineae bacterium]